METTAKIERREVRMVRTREELANLIKEDIEEGDHAGIEYYRRAGEKLKEARVQTARGKWGEWVKANVGISAGTARVYMALADDFEFREALPSSNGEPKWRTITEFRDAYTGEHRSHLPRWHRQVREAMPSKQATAQYHARRRSNADERHLTHQLGLKLIDIGYRALATKMHPDHGGSSEAMTRLNHVRDVLKGALR